jgi:hypothetical protein
MAHRKDPNRARIWQRRIQKQASSSLSIAEFCRREGISPRLFYAWRNRLAKRPASPASEAPLLVALHPEKTHSQADPALDRTVDVELLHEVRLRLDAPPDPEWLRHVVAEMARLPRTGAAS